MSCHCNNDGSGILCVSFPMISAAQFWWDHLTWDQRQFIKKNFLSKLSETEIASIAYENKLDWHCMAHWPETTPEQMSTIKKWKGEI